MYFAAQQSKDSSPNNLTLTEKSKRTHSKNVSIPENIQPKYLDTGNCKVGVQYNGFPVHAGQLAPLNFNIDNDNNNNNNEHISRDMLNCAQQVQIQSTCIQDTQNSRCPNNHAETSN